MSQSDIFINILFDWLVALPIFLVLLALVYFLRRQYLIRKVLIQLPVVTPNTSTSSVTEKSPVTSSQLVHVYCIGNPNRMQQPNVHLPGRKQSTENEITNSSPPAYGEAIKSPKLNYS